VSVAGLLLSLVSEVVEASPAVSGCSMVISLVAVPLVSTATFVFFGLGQPLSASSPITAIKIHSLNISPPNIPPIPLARAWSGPAPSEAWQVGLSVLFSDFHPALRPSLPLRSGAHFSRHSVIPINAQ